jgi:hypothetical protein
MNNVLKKIFPESIQFKLKKTFSFLKIIKDKFKKRQLYIFVINIVISILTKFPGKYFKYIDRDKLIDLKKAFTFDHFDDYPFLTYVKRKKEGFVKCSPSIKTLVVRGSNADYGFYSPAWEGSYNLGLISSDLFTDYHLYVSNKNKLDNLKNVILFISVGSIGGYSLIKTKERYRAVSYKYFFNIPYQDNGYINTFVENKIFKKCKKLKSQEINSNYCGYEKKGYFGTNIITQDRVKSHLRENKREPDQLKWLKSLNDDIISDGRQLFVVIPPVRLDYKILLPPDSVLFRKLYDLNLKGAKILNFYNSEMFSDDDFGDSDHLKEQGAIKLTNEIYRLFQKEGLL